MLLILVVSWLSLLLLTTYSGYVSSGHVKSMWFYVASTIVIQMILGVK